MRVAYYIKKDLLKNDPRVLSMLEDLSSRGCGVYAVSRPEDVSEGTDVLLSFGGDGTFLAASRIAVPSSVPVLGINLGRLGFLSGNGTQDVVEKLLEGDYTVQSRSLLEVEVQGKDVYPLALNEITVSRCGAAMLGVDVSVNSQKLPTYWADGLLVATSSGSTAYSLSVGGPICTPDSDVLVVSPISPHNLNVRPLIVPRSSVIEIGFRSRSSQAVFTVDNLNYLIGEGSVVKVSASSRHLDRISLGKDNFIDALRTRLHWGEDVRNSADNE